MYLSLYHPVSRTAIFLALFLLVGQSASPQEKSVRPGINKDFENPDLKKFLGVFEGESREHFTNRKEIAAACHITPGMTVADIGAGTGFFTRLFATAVGAGGKVYAVDIAPAFIEHIEKTCKEAGIKNVFGVVCKTDSVELPPNSIDLAFICDTYHHFEFPHRTMTSIHQALRPGGKVVLIDFHRIEGKSREWLLNHVRAGQEVFAKEVVTNGFRQVEEKQFLKENYFLVFEKAADTKKPTTKLREWERGIAVESLELQDMAVYLWFYEWHMFDAVKKGEHTQGTFKHPHQVNKEQTEAIIGSPDLQVTVKASDGGADLLLSITNKAEHAWPEIAGIIPCFSPGKNGDNPRNPQFANEKTFFLGPKGLEPLIKREIHFNDKFRKAVEAVSRQGQFVFSDKWPTAEPNAKGGIIIRESTDGRWVTGIAWEDYLSVQGHNPWQCMHLCVRVGPLKPTETKRVRGKIYLFQGTKEECLKRYLADFKIEAPESK